MAKLENNFIFIPGWLDVSENYGLSPGLDIWTKNIDVKEKINHQYVIAYSFGANFALLNWQYNKNTKLVLINPVIYPKSIFSHILSWIRFWIVEKPRIYPNQLRAILQLFPNLKKTYNLIKQDYSRIIFSIPKNDILIIKGGKDNFLCDKKNKEMFLSKGIQVVEIADLGHDLRNKKIINEIKTIFNKFIT